MKKENKRKKLNNKELQKVTGGSSTHTVERRCDEFGGEHFAAGTKLGYITDD